MSLRHILPFWLLILLGSSSRGQRNFYLTIEDLLEVRFESIRAEQGLPHRKVDALFQDHMGFIWMGTPAGLSKYDGYTFQTFQYYQTDSITGKKRSVPIDIQAIDEDTEGDLWIGCGFAGTGKPLVLHFDRETETLTEILLNEDISGRFNNILDIHIGRSYLWFTTPELFRIKLPEASTEEKFAPKVHVEHLKRGTRGLKHNRSLNIYEDRKGQLWFPTLQGVLKWIPVVDTFQYFPLNPLPEGQAQPKVDYYHLLEAEDGWFWAFQSSEDFLMRFHPKGGSREVIPHEPKVLGFESARTPSGKVWFGRRAGLGGINIFDPHHCRFQAVTPHLTGPRIVPNIRVMSMLQDFSNNIWVGTEYGPLLKYEPQRDQFHWLHSRAGEKEALSHNFVSGIAQDNRGHYWISTYGGGLNRWDRQNNTIEQFRAQSRDTDGPLMDYILGLNVSEDGKVWFGEGSVPGSFDLHSGVFRHYRAGRSTIWSFLEDASNRIWYVEDGGTLRRYDPSEDRIIPVRLVDPNDTTKFLQKRLRSIYQDSRENLWIGTFESSNSGFLRYNPTTEEVKLFDLPEARAFCEDQSGDLWIGTIGGLYRYEPETGDFSHYGQEDGLPNNFINAIQQDNTNRLWLATENGLSCFDPDALSFTNYFQSDGLPANDFTHVSYKNQQGELFFGGDFGLLYFHPDSIRKNTIPPKMAFTALELFGETIPIDKNGPLKRHVSLAPQLRFVHWQNDLTIHFAALHFKNPAKNSYLVKLENYDREWQDIGTQNFSHYTNLNPGRYTFRVKAANSDGVWNEEGIALGIIIHPPWYWNGWSKALYLVLITSLILGVYRFQLNRRLALAEAGRLRELDEAKNKLYTNITHEFRTPLTVIQGVSEQISGHQGEKELIRRNSQQLLDLVNRMLDLSKASVGKLKLQLLQGDIIPYLRYVTESFHSLALNQKINLNFHTDLEALDMDYDPEKILQILSNLISNAIKFTPEYGKVTITARKKTEAGTPHLEIGVKDTGTGMEAEQLPLIFDRFHQVDAGPTRRAEGTGIGLALTRELVHLMRGEIRVESRPKVGSLFTVLLPISNQAARQILPEQAGLLPDAALRPSYEEVPGKPFLSSAQNGAGEEKPRLLVVEDNQDVMQFIASCLQGNYELLTACNGREGIEQALEHIPDIIISDIMMPEVDGFELCRTLKQDERTDHIPIILLTAKADQDSKLEGLEYGADAYLVKPFHRMELEIRLRKLIELRRQLQARYQQANFESEPDTAKMDAFVLKARQAVLEYLSDETFGPVQLSRILLLDRSQLYRKLKALTGSSTSIFIRRIRLRRARQLLRESDLTVKETAYKVGFSDPSYFSRVFSEEFGEPPSKV